MNNSIKAVIIDDEKLARDIVKKYLEPFSDFEVIAECSNGFEGIKIINEQKPDVIFLDIQMPKINGFEMLELIEEHPIIIFITAYDQFAIKAFEVNAVDYLLKPFSEQRFKEAINKALFYLKNKKQQINKVTELISNLDESKEVLERVVVKTGNKISIIPTEKILWIEAQDDYVLLNTEDGKFLKQKTMKYFEDKLDPKEYIRIHRSFIVKVSFIKQIELMQKETYNVVLKNGVKLPVSKSGYLKLQNILK
ncbi:MAG: response regulator [Ignavibacteria bacterium]|nr:response regulator [Ignavibacteria bacterium]